MGDVISKNEGTKNFGNNAEKYVGSFASTQEAKAEIALPYIHGKNSKFKAVWLR